MEESLNTTPTATLPRDISEEQYRGPSAYTAAAGAGVLKHFMWAVIGLLGGGIVAYVLHKPSKGIIEFFRNKAEGLAIQQAPGGIAEQWARLKRIAGRSVFAIFGEGERVEAVHVIPTNKAVDAERYHEWSEKILANKKHGFGYAFLSHIPGVIPVFGKKLVTTLINASKAGNERFTNAVTIGGVFGAAGYISGWTSGAFGGGKQSYEGRNQYESLREEHKKLRDQYNSLVVDTPPNEPLSSHALLSNAGQENGLQTTGSALPPLASIATNDNDLSASVTNHHAVPSAQVPSASNDNDGAQPATQHHTAQPSAHHESKTTVDAASIAHQGMQHAHAHHAAAHS